MAVKQKYKESRVNALPTTGLSAGDRYYLNVGGGKYQTYTVSDALQLVKEAGAEFIEKDTMAQMRALSPREIWALQNGHYRGVKLNGYYTKGDTPASIDYNLIVADYFDKVFNFLEKDIQKHSSRYYELKDLIEYELEKITDKVS